MVDSYAARGPNKGDYTAAGIYGQYIYVNPAKNIIIAKNAADREFAYPQDGYTHSMNVNMDLFRSLADYYVPEKKVSSLEQFLQMIAQSEENYEMTNERDFGEVFGLARSSSHTPVNWEKVKNKIKEDGMFLGKEISNPDDLNEIWARMIEYISEQRAK